MTAEEMVRQIMSRLSAPGPAPVEQSMNDALREMYSLARAETAKEVIEAAADMVLEHEAVKDRWQLRGKIRALASRYAETLATSCAAEAPTAPTKESK